MVLARRVDGANQVFVQLKNQLEAGQPRNVVTETVKKMEGLLGVLAMPVLSKSIAIGSSPPLVA